ncbi:type II toxin-antitoxin system VapC family toxin [Agromyces neolithicus]|uniref:Ribonuclease VapC n=1 Tax=Agromyces neolithicus TaxID=269420 RepID=A0ABN2M8W7_9MICO
MIVAVDTSALAKLLVEEDESDHVREFLGDRSRLGDVLVISTIAVTELRRLARRLDIDAAAVEPVVRPFHTLRLTEGILQLAGRFTQPHLGTLDAIHIASALTAEAGELLTFDRQQGAAAVAEGLASVRP